MYKNVLCLLLGLIIGIRLTDFWDYVKLQAPQNAGNTLSLSGSSSSSFSSISDDDYTNMEIDGDYAVDSLVPATNVIDLAAQLYNSTRVLCWVLTTPANHANRAQHLKNTWGQRCNKLLFMSTQQDAQLGSVQLDVLEGRGYLWQKTRLAWRYIYEQHYADADWFLKVDDDTYVIMENLRYFLYPYDSAAPVYFGCKFNPFVRQGYMSGGAGYVLSKEALRRFIEIGYNDTKRCSHNTLSEDKEMGICLQNVGVVAGDSRDDLGRERFLPLSPKHLIPESTSQWFSSYLFYKRDKNAFCCADTAISFHYTKPHEFYIFDYFLYKLQPFGIGSKAETLPIRLSEPNMADLLDKWRHELTDNIFVN